MKDMSHAAVSPGTLPAIQYRRHGPGPDWIKREAKLFEVGEYPDKGVSITQEDLERLAENFRKPVPVLIEHAQSPLELGFLTDVEAREGELYGTIKLSQEADALIRKSGAKALSLGLSRDLQSIREVSLVKNPRIRSARIFAQLVCFEGSVEVEKDWFAEYQTLREEKEQAECEAQIQAFMKDGKLLPTQVEFARALMSRSAEFEFGGDQVSVRGLLIAMIERQLPHQLFAEHSPAPEPEHEANLLLPEEAEFYRKHFPEIGLDQIAQRKI